jgi:hypothetical protein
MEKQVQRSDVFRPTKDPALIGGGRRDIVPNLTEIGATFMNSSRLHYRPFATLRISGGIEEPRPGVFKAHRPSNERRFVLSRRRGLRWHLPFVQRTLRHRIDVGETYHQLTLGRK